MSSIGPPTGMRDWLPQDALLRQHLMETIGRVYRLYGYLPIDTPVMEDLAVLLGKGGGENEKLLFKILKRGEKLAEAQGAAGDLADYGLRFDLTVPLARFVATHQGKLPKVFRRYHIAPVWRADRPQKGRFREFYQCDIDVVGGASPDYEVEIITATERVLNELNEKFNLGKYWFRISDKRLLSLLLEGFGVPANQVSAIALLLDKIDKVGTAQVADEAKALLPQDSDTWKAIWKLIEEAYYEVDHEQHLKKSTEHYEKHFARISNQRIRSAINEVLAHLDVIIKSVRQINQRSRIIFHPILVRGMDYYTGPVYEAVMHGDRKTAILGGGRYDGLIGRFANKDIPAVGCSIGFERILALLQERKEGHAAAPTSRVLLVNDSQPADLLQQQAEQLRNAGLCVETALDQDDLGRQFKYAETAGILWAIRRFDPTASSVTVRYLPERKDLTMSLADFLTRLGCTK